MSPKKWDKNKLKVGWGGGGSEIPDGGKVHGSQKNVEYKKHDGRRKLN